MQVTQDQGPGDSRILRITGEVDLKSSPSLRSELQQVLSQKPPALLIDLENCSYIDSSGIATFVEALQMLNTFQGKLALVRVTQRVKDIFEIAHLDGIFPMFPSMEDAARELGLA